MTDLHVGAPGPSIDSQDISLFDDLLDEAEDPAASSRSTDSSGSYGRDRTEADGLDLAEVLDMVRAHLAKYISVVNDSDLDTLVLWVAHTWCVRETYTTPRLVLDSPVPESGKTTVLEHMARLACKPVQMSAISSSALLPRMLEHEPRTVMIDEADRALDPKKPDIGDITSVINSGYKVGASRPVLVKGEGGAWEPREMSTFAAVVMAGNSPDLADDTRSRCIDVMLLPAGPDEIDESDWELIDDATRDLGEILAGAIDKIRGRVRAERPPLPEGCRSRARERWLPLKRVAAIASDEWAERVDRMILQDLETKKLEREEGLRKRPPHIALLHDVAAVLRAEEQFIATSDLLARLVAHDPFMWGAQNSFGNPLTAQRMGRMLSKNYRLLSTRRPNGDRARGYLVSAFRPLFVRLSVPHPFGPDDPDEAGTPDGG